MKQRVLYLFASCFCAFALIVTPLWAIAEGPQGETPIVYTSPVVITEIQTGASAAGEEFIELYNISDEPVDISGWQIRYVNAGKLPDETKHLAEIEPGEADDPILLQPNAYFVLHTDSVELPPTVTSKQLFEAGLAKTDKTVGLFAANGQTCQFEVVDAVAWKASGETTFGEGGALDSTSINSGEKLLQRYRYESGAYVDESDNKHDFAITEPSPVAVSSPGSDNTNPLAPDAAVAEPALSQLSPVEIEGCIVPGSEEPPSLPPSSESPPSIIVPPEGNEDKNSTAIPAANAGLKSPQLSELLPNPGKPQTDAKDEFVEIYNPNDKSFDLSGYVLETGVSRKHRHTFPDGTLLKPKTFLAVFSGDTSLSLTNSNGQARFIDPLGNVLAESAVYESAKDNQAWVNANGKWQWTAKPTPNAVNVVQAPASKEKSDKKKSSVKNASSTRSGNSSGGSGDGEDSDQAVAATTTGSPLHPGLLALVGGFALLYGAYEYRHDIANKIRKFRTNRTARSASGPGAKGR